jgi:hypothetical protein
MDANRQICILTLVDPSASKITYGYQFNKSNRLNLGAAEVYRGLLQECLDKTPRCFRHNILSEQFRGELLFYRNGRKKRPEKCEADLRTQKGSLI